MALRFPATEMQGKGIVIVGVGTMYAGDDAVGLIVAERLRDRRPERATVILHGGEGASLLALLEGTEAAIVVDAMHSGAAPGAVRRFDVSERRLPARAFRHSTHAFGVADAVELGHAMQQLPSRFIVYGIEGQSFGAGDRLSAEVEAAVPLVVERVVEEAGAAASHG